MSRQNLAAPLLGAAALVGGGVYYTRKSTDTSGDPAQQTHGGKPRPTTDEVVANKKQQADAKRDLGLGGAGVGMNQTTGGTELGSGLKSGNTENPNRDAPKGPKDKFPSDAGEIGGGQGRGKTNARSIEWQGPSTGGSAGDSSAGSVGGGPSAQSSNKEDSKDKPSSSSYAGSQGNTGGGTDSNSVGSQGGISQRLQGFFRQGGDQEGEKPRQAPMDTKVASNLSDTPTKRGGSPFDKHRKDVTAVSPTES
ncbi:uncharacterized protein CTRU02_208310 [Colletotrichum truncatum]|uniref:Uncharacterized protein n=1 Tax=Colletotrichum truncatum TaxID=5467 RepID=A0ACC3YVX2_COLTU|nr:uncharacterized protein CTRU02_07509 [Colletotrichum truncatum]KAF6791169.1 hypothetical protein CTRU02_07509 [Colletotrichum truncatum]